MTTPAELCRAYADLCERIAAKVDGEERSLYDDDVLELVEEIDFADLAAALRWAAERS